MIVPTSLRIDASSICQLRCALCRAAGEDKKRNIGYGFLRFDHFKSILDRNPQIERIELANWGEVFLNKDLPKLLELAHRRSIATYIEEGANLNHASPEALEAVVAFKTRVIHCAIDGATNATYMRLRIGGDLQRVVENIRKINEFKDRYHSAEPRLVLQFVVHGHNVHEMGRAIVLARLLRMDISFKLSFFPQALSRRQIEEMRKHIPYKDEDEFLQQEGRHYMRHQCYQMWRDPQVNWDGKLLGCCRNIWGNYAENVFEDDLVACLNNEKMNVARRTLMGKEPPGEDMPCVKCSVFKSMVKSGKWITDQEIHP